jgi:hypothetical protein
MGSPFPAIFCALSHVLSFSMPVFSFSAVRSPPKRITANLAASTLPRVTLSPAGFGTHFSTAFCADDGVRRLVRAAWLPAVHGFDKAKELAAAMWFFARSTAELGAKRSRLHDDNFDAKRL